MQRFFNIAFPLDDPVISPLYTHVDTRASGTIYWSETDSPDVLARAGGLIRSAFKDANNFMPTDVFLVTWMDVGYYDERNDKASCYLYDYQILYVFYFLNKSSVYIRFLYKICFALLETLKNFCTSNEINIHILCIKALKRKKMKILRLQKVQAT